jgi:MOSC domain-containing protein YiiM
LWLPSGDGVEIIILVELLHLYISPGHNYRGHHGGPADAHPILEVQEVRCVAGRGIEGDRYFDEEPDFKGQITFFADEVHRALCEQFNLPAKPPSVFRRNVITRGVDLDSLVGREFEVQGVRFFGVESCKPCYWMDQAFCPGAEAAMQGRGGLRARILSDGVLRTMATNSALRRNVPLTAAS